MRILHVADLHFDLEHYDWLEMQAPYYDLVVMAGDLLERYGSDKPLPAQQQLVLAALSRTAQRVKWLAVCTGNHDVAAYDKDWLNPLKRFPNCILDGQNKLTEAQRNILVTCCPWLEPGDAQGEDRLKTLLSEGANLRLKYDAMWLIVHHSPPGFGVEGEVLVETIRNEQPDFVFSGHDHQTPFTKGPFNRFGRTLCLNPGCPPQNRRLDVPPFIRIDSDAETVVWQWGSQQITCP